MKPFRILITGGAGFIGSNLTNRLLRRGYQVLVYDNLSRSGCLANLSWLKEEHGSNSFKLIKADLADENSLKKAADGVDVIYHLAGQVAVTTSVTNPKKDFLDNAYGTFNVLEAARLVANNPIFIYASTNKVYGSLEQIGIEENLTSYSYRDLPYGIPESYPIDFHSPYGCSKGAGDQYTRDYARIYGLRTVVLRQSCIYGYRQFGVEDQGWVAWFLIAALKKKPIKIYGNGKQVRDILFIDDLIDLYELVVEKINLTKGQIYNVGGGPENTMSVWVEFKDLLEDILGESIQVQFGKWRPGDQRIYVSDIRKVEKELGWHPRITVQNGVRCLANWIKDNQSLFSHL